MNSIEAKKDTAIRAASRETLKRAAAFALAFLTLLSFAGCARRDPVDPYEVVDITGGSEAETAAPVTPAPPTEIPTEAPTEAPTPESTATPEPTFTPAPTKDPSVVTRRVYLTFDDGPSKNTPEVLDILKKYGVKATFFTVGRFVSVYPDTAKRIVEEGHLLACHTYSHDFSIIYQDPDHFVADVAKWRSAVKKAVGYDAGAYVFRFPGGSTNSTIGGRSGRKDYLKAMHKEGYLAMDWNLGLNDKWLAGNKDHLPIEEYLWKSYQETWSYFKDKPPLILIIHDTEPASVNLLERLIEDLIAKGCEFGLCDELTEDYLM
ncbi:MAG: polysaccharide deacetylase family protein [Clostridiales bacterium]|nr:polysaccharide deacetylase family protein [Clostridiales bacterium]